MIDTQEVPVNRALAEVIDLATCRCGKVLDVWTQDGVLVESCDHCGHRQTHDPRAQRATRS